MGTEQPFAICSERILLDWIMTFHLPEVRDYSLLKHKSLRLLFQGVSPSFMLSQLQRWREGKYNCVCSVVSFWSEFNWLLLRQSVPQQEKTNCVKVQVSQAYGNTMLFVTREDRHYNIRLGLLCSRCYSSPLTNSFPRQHFRENANNFIANSTSR